MSVQAHTEEGSFSLSLAIGDDTYLTAIVMSMAACSEKDCNAADEASLYKGGDIASLGKTNKTFALSADALLAKLRC